MKKVYIIHVNYEGGSAQTDLSSSISLVVAKYDEGTKQSDLRTSY